MSDTDNLSPLERMQRRLYTPGGAERYRTQALAEHAPIQKAEGWEHPEPPAPKEPKRRMSVTLLFLIISAAFFVVAGAVAAVLVITGGRLVSPNNVLIAVSSDHTSIASGDTVALVITITNKNPVPLTGATVSANYPDGSRSADDVSKPLANYTDSLGDIAPGASVTRTTHVVLFGSENQSITIPVSLEYTTDKSNSTFEQKKDYALTVTTSPLSLSVTSASQTASGQPMSLVVSVRSNASTPVDAAALQATYPPGFTFTSAVPTPVTGNLFSLGTFAPGEEKTIRINGSLAGIENDQRVFTFTVGTLGASGGAIEIPYATKTASITVSQPFLAVSLALNHETSDSLVVQAGQPISGVLTWANNLPSPVLHGQVSVKFTGNALDTGSVQVTNGFFRSADNTILFDGSTSNGLAALQAGDTGTGTFSFLPKAVSALNGVHNPSITLSVSISGQQTGQGTAPSTVSSTATRTIKIATDFALSAHAVRTQGPFANTGPLPPQPNQETTYTVLLTAANNVNSIGGGTASFTLPPYVRWMGKTSPSTESVTYDDATRKVTWNIGDQSAGTTRQAAFQVAFTPSTSQSGTSPVLVTGITLVGTDRFTQTQVSSTVSDITTQTPNDPTYVPANGSVQ